MRFLAAARTRYLRCRKAQTNVIGGKRTYSNLHEQAQQREQAYEG
jgi:hypothetical protein